MRFIHSWSVAPPVFICGGNISCSRIWYCRYQWGYGNHGQNFVDKFTKLSFECFTDFWKFSSAIVEIWFLVGWLVTCHQFQTFLGFSGNFISDFNEKIFQTSHIVLGVLQNHQYNVEQYKRICWSLYQHIHLRTNMNKIFLNIELMTKYFPLTKTFFQRT